jgi:hypothetical protein
MRLTSFYARAMTFALLVTLLASAPVAEAGNGDILQVSKLLAGNTLSDLTYDDSATSSGGSFWVLGEQSGFIYHVSSDLRGLQSRISNPHGPAVFPIPILSVGIAYRKTSDTLFVLAQGPGTWEIKEVSTTVGSEVLSFPVVPPNAATAILHGLTYDAGSDSLWSIDSNNDTLLKVSLAQPLGAITATLPLPGSESSTGSNLRGEGLCFDAAAGGPGLYVTHGDIFTRGPSRIVQLQLSGECTGVEVPIGLIDVERFTGVQSVSNGQRSRMILIGGSQNSPDSLYEIEQVVPEVAPPSHLTCSLTLNGRVRLTWDNNGTLGSGAYRGDIQVLRNGAPLTTLPGTSQSYTDRTPLVGLSVYGLRAAALPGGELSPESFRCQITVGPGGLVRWVAFPGNEPYDIAENPATGEVFVTDPIGVAGEGKIYRFDAQLNLLGEIPSPWMSPGPIAFIPHVEIEIPFAGTQVLDNVLAIGSTAPASRRQLRVIDLTGHEVAPLFRLSDNIDSPEPQINSLTFVPETSEFVFVEGNNKTIVTLNQNGNFINECKPADFILPTPLAGGLGYDAAQGTYLALFTDGVVRELFRGGSCLPTTCVDCNFGLDTLGEGFDTEGFFGGMVVARNSLFICAKESNAIFQSFIFPSGPAFKRGDFNRDDRVELTDAVLSATYLFETGIAPSCPDAVDSNDDGFLDISDPVYLLFFLFLQGDPPPAPYPNAGDDPTFRDGLGCDEI